MVNFVLGGFGSLAEVLDVISATTTNVNQGATGGYMVATWVSLSALGASTFAMRLPSLLFGVYLLWASWVFLRTRAVGWLGLLAVPIVFAGQTTLMHYVGEARTYMPLAAAAVGVLTYYSLDETTRQSWRGRTLGWSAVAIGVVFHPYFALYWPVLLLFAWFVAGRPPLLRFANPLLVTVGTIVYFGIATQTWLRGVAPADLDPYHWLDDPLWRAIVAHLFELVYVQRWLELLAVVVLAALFVIAAASTSWRRALQVAAPPIALTGIALALAATLAWISIRQDFWIIPRQWIASIALVPLALIWLTSALVRITSTRHLGLSRAFAGVLFAIAVVAAVAPVQLRIQQLREWSSRASSSTELRAELASRIALDDYPTEDEWVAYAQSNLDQGGPVWPDFTWYYAGRDWSTFILQD